MSKRQVHIDIGLDGCFMTRRWEEPESFMRITRELGYPYHEFSGDVLDPFFSGDKAFQLETARKVKKAAQRHGVIIPNVCTGMATYRFHGLSHSHPSPRARMKQWIVDMMDICREMGVDRLAGHWDAIPVEVLQDSNRTREAHQRLYATFRELARLAQERGIVALYDEQMYTPGLVPGTLAQAKEFLIEVNRDREGSPVYLLIDTGHAAGKRYGADGPDIDYLEWLRRFAAFSEFIHLQQTPADASAHWPFTEEYNRAGHIRIPDLLEAIAESQRRAFTSPVAEHLPPVDRNLLYMEVIPSSAKPEEVVLRELRESRDYVRQFIPEGGLTIEV